MRAEETRRDRIPAAILMSGTGSNARKLLEYARRSECAYRVRVIISDNPDSNYRRIAEDLGVPAELNDIYAFFGVPRDRSRRIGLSSRIRKGARASIGGRGRSWTDTGCGWWPWPATTG